jgi:drug/metabolite transporter (DMT)-like permease
MRVHRPEQFRIPDRTFIVQMSKYPRIHMLLWWMLLVASDTIAQLLLKSGAVQASSSSPVNSLILGGYSLYIISFIAWMQILRNTRLFIALSAASILYVTVAFASHFFIGERITPPLLVGTVLIATGVFILGFRENS